MKVRYTSPAAAELASILDDLAEKSPRGAHRVLARILALERLLSAFPECGDRTRLPWLRRLSASPMPYVLFYEVADTEIIVHRVRHSARKPAE